MGKIFLLEKLLGKAMSLSDTNWTRLTYGWSIAFLSCAGLNLWVAENFSMDVWVTFKFAGLMGLQLIFIVLTVGYLLASGALADTALDQPDPKDS